MAKTRPGPADERNTATWSDSGYRAFDAGLPRIMEGN